MAEVRKNCRCRAGAFGAISGQLGACFFGVGFFCSTMLGTLGLQDSTKKGTEGCKTSGLDTENHPENQYR